MGQLTDEVATNEKPNLFIDEFVSAGPKNYAYSIFNPDDNSREYVIKVKGIKLNTDTLEKITFDSIKSLVDEYIFDNMNREITVSQPKFNLNWNHDILMKKNDKKYKLVYTNRIIQPDYSTRPYGY